MTSHQLKYKFCYSGTRTESSRVSSATVTGTFAQTTWKTYRLFPTILSTLVQSHTETWSTTIKFDFPLPTGPFGGRVFYYYTINRARWIDYTKKTVTRVFDQSGYPRAETYNVLELEDLQIGRIGVVNSSSVPVNAIPAQISTNHETSVVPQLPSPSTPLNSPPPYQKEIQAIVQPKARQKLSPQARTGMCLFRWPGNLAAKEVLVTGVYDIWGRSRVEKLLWSAWSGCWELALQVSIPAGQEVVSYAYIVDGVKTCNRVNDLQLYQMVMGSDGVLRDYNYYAPIDISDPVWVPTKYTGLPSEDDMGATRFVCVLRTEFPKLQPQTYANIGLAGGDIYMHNPNLGELTYSSISQKWEIRVAFDWSPQINKIYFQFRGFQGEGAGWRTFVDTGLPSEGVDLNLDDDVKKWWAATRAPRITRNFIPLWSTQRVKWPWKESVTPMGKYKFSWGSSNSLTSCSRVKVEGPFTQDPLIQVARDLEKLPDGTWSATLELPARKMRYRYLVDGMYQTNWDESREMDEANERWNVLQEQDFVIEDYDEDLLDITISRSTFQALLEGTLSLDRLPSEVKELLISPKGAQKAINVSGQSSGFELSAQAKDARANAHA